MNLRKKITGFALGLVLSLGVGVGFGSTHSEASEGMAEASTNVTYKIGGTSSKPTITTSETRTGPTGSSASYSQTYDNGLGQMIFGNNTTLTLSGYAGYKITGLTLSMKSNAKRGAGIFSMKAGDTTLAEISTATTFDKWFDNTTYSSNYKDVVVTLTNSDYPIEADESVVVYIEATINSLYIQSYTFTYEEAGVTEATGLTIIPSATSVYAGEELSLNTELTGGSGAFEKTISWTSSNASVIATPADSEEGKEVTLTALSEGTTIITGTVVSPGSATASIEIEVKATRTQTAISLHGTIEKTSYYIDDTWDLTGLDLEITWSEGDPTYVNLSDADVAYECNPKTAVDVSVTSFEISVTYGKFDETFTVSGITVVEKPTEDTLRVDAQSINITKGSTITYTDFSGITNSSNDINSNATWAGKAAYNKNNGEALQLNGTSRAIYTTASSDQKIVKVSMSYSTENTSSKLYFYGSNKAYTAINSSISSDKNSRLIATLDKDSLSADITGNYRYLYIYSSGAIYLKSIVVTWESDTYESDALAFGATFLSTTSAPCVDPSLDNSKTLKDVWPTLETAYGNLSASAKQFVKDAVANESGTDLENAMARYEHIIARYSATYEEISDFIGRDVLLANASNKMHFNGDTNSTMLAVVLTYFASATAIGACFFLKKRKHN